MGEELVADNEEEGRLTGEGCWFWKRKLKLQWLQGEGDITNEKRVESSHSSGTGGTRRSEKLDSGLGLEKCVNSTALTRWTFVAKVM